MKMLAGNRSSSGTLVGSMVISIKPSSEMEKSTLVRLMVISIKSSSEMEKKQSDFDLACQCSPAMFVTVNQQCISISRTYSSLCRTGIDVRTCPTMDMFQAEHKLLQPNSGNLPEKLGIQQELLQPNSGNLQEKLGIQQELTQKKKKKKKK